MFTTDTGVENFYVFDGSIGNTPGLINAAGAVTATYAYDPYGDYATTSSTGSAAGLNPYCTAGGIYDRTTDWIKFGQRWYNSRTGRFTQQDSIEHFTNPQQGNRYAYAADNPVNNVDPTGRSWYDPIVEGVETLEWATDPDTWFSPSENESDCAIYGTGGAAVALFTGATSGGLLLGVAVISCAAAVADNGYN